MLLKGFCERGTFPGEAFSGFHSGGYLYYPPPTVPHKHPQDVHRKPKVTRSVSSRESRGREITQSQAEPGKDGASRLTGSPGKPLSTELWNPGVVGGSWWGQALSRRHATVPTARTSMAEPLEGGPQGRGGPLVSSQPSLCSTGLTPPEAAPVFPSLFGEAWLPSRSLPWAKTQRGSP